MTRVIALLLLALPALADVELVFVVDDDRLIKAAGTSKTLAKVPLKELRRQARTRSFECEMEWESNRERSTRFVEDLVGRSVTGRWTVWMLPPEVRAGTNYGFNVIEWGGKDRWPTRRPTRPTTRGTRGC